jgi:hypothetical protein
MLKTRIGLLIIGALYLAVAMLGASQSLDRRITVVEEKLANRIDTVITPTLQRLNELEARVNLRDLQIEGRLVALEQSVDNARQLLMAVGAGVLIQLLSSAIGGLRAVRSRQSST